MINLCKEKLIHNVILLNFPLTFSIFILQFLFILQQSNANFSRDLNPLKIAFSVFSWFEITVIKGNISVTEDEKLLSEDENVRSMRDYYGAKIEIAELRSSASESFIETPPDSTFMHSSNRKFHFICFVNSDEFLLLNSKIPDLQSHSVLIIIPLSKAGVSPDEAFDKWARVFSTLRLNIDSEIYFTVPHIASEVLTIYEYYKICDECLPIRKRVCDFDMGGLQTETDCTIDKYQRRGDLNGTIFNVIGVDVQPFYANISSSGATKGNESKINGGMLAEIFVSLARDLNFKYSLNVLNGYKYGSFINGSWNGMIGTLSEKEADMSISEISIAPDRLSYIDFTISFDSVGRKIYIRRTRQERKINWQFFSSPFSRYLHASIAFCAVTLTAFFWAFVKICNFKVKKNELNLAESSWLVLSCLCQQGSYFIPKGQTVKILFIVTYFTSLILFSFYSATLISQLSVVPPVKLPFRDLSGLVQAHGWLGGPIKGDLSHIYMEKTCPEILKNSTDSTNIPCQLLTQMWIKLVHKDSSTLPTNFLDGLNKVLKGRYAFVASSTGTRYRINNELSERDSCFIHEMEGDYVSSNLAFGLKKGNPYKRIIDYKLLKLWQSGTINRLKATWAPQRKICISKESSVYKDATIYDVAAAPLGLIFGQLLSSFIFLLEWLIARGRQKSRIPSFPFKVEIVYYK